MKATHRIVRNGNASQVAIPKGILEFLRWRQGDAVIVELTERRTVEIREPTMLDLRTPGPSQLLERGLFEGTK